MKKNEADFEAHRYGAGDDYNEGPLEKSEPFPATNSLRLVQQKIENGNCVTVTPADFRLLYCYLVLKH
jgi:hypothetical protein